MSRPALPLRHWSAARALVALATVLAAATGRAERPAEQAVPVGGGPFAARCVGLSSTDVQLRDDAGLVRRWPLQQLASWGARRKLRPGPQVLLVGGGVIRADLMAVRQQQILLGTDPTAFGSSLPIWDAVAAPRSSVQGVIWLPPDDPLERDQLAGRLREAGGEEDQLFVDQGSLVRGRLLESAPPAGAGLSQLPMLVRGREVQVPLQRITAVRLNAAPAAPPTTGMLLGFLDGSCLPVQSVEAEGDPVRLQLIRGGQAEMARAKFWEQLCLVRPLGPQVQYLGDQAPDEYQHRPFLSLQRQPGFNRSLLGGLLRTDDRIYSKGLGVPSTSYLVYEVAPQWERLEALAALDRTAGRRGSVRFRVFVQKAEQPWQTALRTPVIRGGDPPRPVSVDLDGVTRVALVVEFAERGDERDYANWLNARLVRRE